MFCIILSSPTKYFVPFLTSPVNLFYLGILFSVNLKATCLSSETGRKALRDCRRTDLLLVQPVPSNSKRTKRKSGPRSPSANTNQETSGEGGGGGGRNKPRHVVLPPRSLPLLPLAPMGGAKLGGLPYPRVLFAAWAPLSRCGRRSARRLCKRDAAGHRQTDMLAPRP